MLALTIGIASLILRENLVAVSTSFLVEILENLGTRRTSSKVRPTRDALSVTFT